MGEGSWGEDGCGLLVTAADAVDESLSYGGDIFAMFAEGWNGETDGGEAEGEIRQEETFAGELPQGGVSRYEKKEALCRRFALQNLDEIEQQALAGGGKQIDAVQVEGSGER